MYLARVSLIRAPVSSMINEANTSPLAFCIIDDRAIFLDVDGDRYFSLPSKLNQAFIEGATRPDRLTDEHRLRLTRLGIIGDVSTGPTAVRLQFCSPACGIEPKDPSRFLLPAAIAQSHMRFRLRYWSFSRIIRFERRRRKENRRQSTTLELSQLYASFCTLSAWFGEEDQCLARALAFRALAMKRGHDASLVVGVKLDPFAAHCWIQDDRRLLNDRLERVRLFTPILVC